MAEIFQYDYRYFDRMYRDIIQLQNKQDKNKINSLMILLKNHDQSTFDHSFQVAHFAYNLAFESGLSAKECQEIFIAGLLHDIGKLFVPSILINRNKEKDLTGQQHKLLISHGRMGADLIRVIGLDESYALAADQHWIGELDSRSPTKKELNERHRYVPFVTIADLVASAFDQNRKYQKDYHPEEVINYISKRFDSGIFSNELRDPFNKLMTQGRHTYWYGKTSHAHQIGLNHFL